MDLKKAGNYFVKVVTLSALMQTSFANPMEYYYQRYLEKTRPMLADKTIKEGRFQQLIDHNNPAAGVFLQRYYIDETYGSSDDSSVFFYICGESACSKNALNGAIRMYAQKFHARLIALEHRFYGESFPYNNLSTKSLSALSTKVALQDLANFQQTISSRKGWVGKWVAFGGSYPGSLSAYYRLQYPNLVVGSLASSAPVMAKEDFYEYDAHVTRVAGPVCANKMRLAVSEAEEAIVSKNAGKIAEIKAMFAADSIKNDVDFLYLMADVGASAVQYGMHHEFCAFLDQGSSPLDGYAKFAKLLFDKWDITALDFTAEGAMSEDLDDYSKGIGLRQWYYQSCTEYGYWQNANEDKQQSTRSTMINNDYHHTICLRLFGMKTPVNTDAINSTYYFPLMDSSVSQIYFTNGANDPWSNLSLMEKNGNANNQNLTYTLIDGAAHCDDLRQPKAEDSPSLKSTRETMVKLLSIWLR